MLSRDELERLARERRFGLIRRIVMAWIDGREPDPEDVAAARRRAEDLAR